MTPGVMSQYKLAIYELAPVEGKYLLELMAGCEHAAPTEALGCIKRIITDYFEWGQGGGSSLNRTASYSSAVATNSFSSRTISA